MLCFKTLCNHSNEVTMMNSCVVSGIGMVVIISVSSPVAMRFSLSPLTFRVSLVGCLHEITLLLSILIRVLSILSNVVFIAIPFVLYYCILVLVAFSIASFILLTN